MNTQKGPSQKSVNVVDGFFEGAASMREHYDQRFSAPLTASEDRFQWDYWYVPGQYCLHRAPAHLFFPEDLYAEFEASLCQWGQEQLGCSEISTPWISYYVHGGEQRLHADNPHGPWAYVYSLTNWSEKKFEGGLTQILSEGVLDYWNQAEFRSGLETQELFDSIEPEFNRLCVFDPRRPHGVSRVHGSEDPRFARIVLHGWFLQPKPEVQGGLEEEDLSEALGEVLNPALDEVDSGGQYHGHMLFRLSISPKGEVTDIDTLLGTLRKISVESQSTDWAQSVVNKALLKASFPEASRASVLTMPLVFE